MFNKEKIILAYLHKQKEIWCNKTAKETNQRNCANCVYGIKTDSEDYPKRFACSLNPVIHMLH